MRVVNILRGAVAGRSPLIPTDNDINLGPAPERVDRQLMVGNRGKTGPNTNSFPPTFGMEFVGHVPTVHVIADVADPPTPKFDDRAIVPAVYAGNPL